MKQTFQSSLISEIIKLFLLQVQFDLECIKAFFSSVQEAFHVYLNKFEIVVTHLFFVILCKS